jgi:hypothetical protein
VSQSVSRNFPRIFKIFVTIFGALQTFTRLYCNCFCTRNDFRKIKKLSFHLGPARRLDPHPLRPSHRPGRSPSEPDHGLPGQAAAASIASLGVRAKPGGRTYIATSAGSPCALAPSVGLASRRSSLHSAAALPHRPPLQFATVGRRRSKLVTPRGSQRRAEAVEWLPTASWLSEHHNPVKFRATCRHDLPPAAEFWPPRPVPSTGERLFVFVSSSSFNFVLPGHRSTAAREVLSWPPLLSAVGQDSARLLPHPPPVSNPTWFPTPPLPPALPA